MYRYQYRYRQMLSAAARADAALSAGNASAGTGTENDALQPNKLTSDTDSVALTPTSDSSAGSAPTAGQARFALIVLTAINGINYFDRYIPSSTKDLFKADLDLTDSETSVPITSFLIVYMLVSPVFGWFADHGYSRKRILFGMKCHVCDWIGLCGLTHIV